MEELAKESKLNHFIHNFLYVWVGTTKLRKLSDVHYLPPEQIKQHMTSLEEAFQKYCQELGYSTFQTNRVYVAAFFWRKGPTEAHHVFQLKYEEAVGRYHWFGRQRIEAEKAASCAAVLKAAAAPPIVLELDQTVVDMPLIYWVLHYEMEEAHEQELAEIAHGD